MSDYQPLEAFLEAVSQLRMYILTSTGYDEKYSETWAERPALLFSLVFDRAQAAISFIDQPLPRYIPIYT